MGYLRHEAIIVNGSVERVLRAHSTALLIFENNGLGRLVGSIILHAVNGGASFLIAPDGSKEGWELSERGNKARTEFCSWLASKEASALFLEWCQLVVGGDDGEYKITASPNDQPELKD